MKIGIDFGTTNSAVCYYHQGKINVVDFASEAQEGSELYMPTVVAIKTRLGRSETYFGQAAKVLAGQLNASVYQNVKMLLDADEKTLKKYWPMHADKPEAIAQLFIEHLLVGAEKYSKEPIEAITFAIPEVWDRDQSKSTKILADTFRKVAKTSITVSSRREPVTAAAYFLHKWKETNPKQFFNGHLLVCDCGGGTMDYCLVEVKQQAGSKDNITPLERAGYGSTSIGSIGHAGVAFDQAMVKAIFGSVALNEFMGLVHEFERHKIIHQSEVKDYVKTYRISPDMVVGESCFSVRNKPIYVADLVRVFDEVVKVNIDASIAGLKASFPSHGVNSDDPNKFRVLLVGGFSAFYLTQEAIRTAFGSQLEDDWRFDDLLNNDERALAIAKGAALFASDMVLEKVVSPVEIGVIASHYNKTQGIYDKDFFPVVDKGSELKHLTLKPKWYQDKFLITEQEGTLELYLDLKVSSQYKPIKFDLSIYEIRKHLPGAQEIKLGFSVDDDRVFYLHVEEVDKKNANGSIQIRLGDLWEKIPSLIVAN